MNLKRKKKKKFVAISKEILFDLEARQRIYGNSWNAYRSDSLCNLTLNSSPSKSQQQLITKFYRAKNKVNSEIKRENIMAAKPKIYEKNTKYSKIMNNTNILENKHKNKTSSNIVKKCSIKKSKNIKNLSDKSKTKTTVSHTGTQNTKYFNNQNKNSYKNISFKKQETLRASLGTKVNYKKDLKSNLFFKSSDYYLTSYSVKNKKKNSLNYKLSTDKLNNLIKNSISFDPSCYLASENFLKDDLANKNDIETGTEQKPRFSDCKLDSSGRSSESIFKDELLTNIIEKNSNMPFEGLSLSFRDKITSVFDFSKNIVSTKISDLFQVFRSKNERRQNCNNNNNDTVVNNLGQVIDKPSSSIIEDSCFFDPISFDYYKSIGTPSAPNLQLPPLTERAYLKKILTKKS